jgi:hypothetical protein
MGKAYAVTPLLLLPVVAYNLLVLTLGGFLSPDVNSGLTAPLFETPTASGGRWPVSLADLMLAAALVILFVELIKPTFDRRSAMINHIASIGLFVACLVEMLAVPAFATSTFFLITLMVLLDVLAGFILGAATRRPEPKSRR